MSKKKVTAPLTYNPGKGRPKEYLAYLNYQEMQALKRLNGEGPYKGPKGLPSFVLGGAKTSGTAANSAMKSASQSSGSRPSSGGRDSGIRDSVGANRPSASGSSRGDVGGRDSGTRDSVGANRPSASGASRGDVAGRDGGIRNVAGASTPDKSAISSANRTNTVSAQNSPAFKADTGRTVNVGPMGTPVKIGAEVKRPTVPKATVASPMATQGTSFASPLDARIENFQRINDARFKAGALGPEGVPSVSQIAAENARRLNAVKMAQQYSQYRSPPMGYPAAPQGVYGPRAGVDTRYLGTTDMPGMITTDMTSPYSGAVDPRFSAASTLRAYEAAKRVPGKIQDRVPPSAPGKTRGIGDVPLPQSQYSGYGAEGYSTLSGIPTPQGYGSLPQYPNYRPPGESSAYDPRRLAAYDSTFGPELLGASGSEIEKALLNEDFRRQAAGTFTSPYDVAPSYPNYGPPSKGLGLGGFNPVAPRNDLQRMGAGTYTSPYDVSPPQTNESVRTSYLSMMNPTIGETLTSEGSPYALSKGERAAMDKLYNERMSLENTSEGVPGDETPPNDYVDGSDVYGPEYVSPEIQELMREQEKLNKRGVGAMKRVPVVGPVVTAADALTKLFTGKTIAGSSADLKRAYMQASDEQKAALEDKYPNLTKFASDAGLTPKRDMSNYTNWAEKSGLRAPPSREGGRDNSGIASLGGRPKGDETTTPTPDTPSTTPGRRPDIYYMWDLGVNVPSPGDPNYNQYQTYLAERLAAQRAMG